MHAVSASAPVNSNPADEGQIANDTEELDRLDGARDGNVGQNDAYAG